MPGSCVDHQGHGFSSLLSPQTPVVCPKGAIKGMTELVKQYSNKGKYGGDLGFLNEKVAIRSLVHLLFF